MIALLMAATVAAQPAPAANPHGDMAGMQHGQMSGMQHGQHEAMKDCCKDCCGDMAKKHEGHTGQ